MSNIAIVLGAGAGTRMKSETNKMLLPLMGKTVLERSVEAFAELSFIDEIIVTAREQELDEYIRLLNNDKITFVLGGATRQESVKNAVETIDEADFILIHDGARPFIRQTDIEKTLLAAKECGAAAVGVPVKDTIKVIDGAHFVINTPDRASLFAVQTPQVFAFALYKEALRHASAKGLDCTDDCQLLEAYGKPVRMVEGDYTNIKITTPDDIAVGETILLNRIKRG